jgi:hypothetical protein
MLLEIESLAIVGDPARSRKAVTASPPVVRMPEFQHQNP